jgi:thiol:disulfide interchange protein DsbD
VFASLLRLLCLAAGLSSPAAAAESHFPVHASDATIAPGSAGKVQVVVGIANGYHIYRDRLEVTVTDAGGLTVGAPSYPPGLMEDDPGAPGTKRETYEDDIVVDVPVTAPAAAGSHSLVLHVFRQGCSKKTCDMPEEEDVTATVKVAGAAGALDAGVVPTVGDATTPAEGAPAEGAAPEAAAAGAGDPAAETAVVFAAKPGAPNEVRVHADLQGEWHINKAFVALTLVDADGYTLGEPVLPAGVKSGSEADGTAREDFTDDLDLVAAITGPPGKVTVKVDVAYQACKGASLCKMPTSEIVEVPVTIGAATTAASMGGGGFAQAASGGLPGLLALCFLAGIGVSFTPCVLPMVPITMGLIGAKGAGSRAKAVSLSATYVLGMASIYTVLGVFAGVTGSLFGSQLQSPWVVGAISLFFVGMGFSMFGFFDVQMPSFVMSRMSGKSGGGYVGAAVLGVIGAFLAGPCSGPVVASILAVIGKGGKVGEGALLMFAFSLGIGMIFLVTGAASGWLPARGMWMVTVKKAFGVVLWLGAIYYAAPQLSTSVTALATAGVLLVTGVFGWPAEEDGEEMFLQRFRQLYAIAGGLVAAYLLVGTLVHDGFILPPASMSMGSAGAAVAQGPKIPWLSSEAEAVALAKSTGKPLMIDFTAEWCAACHEMERFTYTDAQVIAAAEGFVPVMLDCTAKGDPNILALQKKYGVTGLPTVVFVTPDGAIVDGTVGFVEASEFAPKMKAVLGGKG